MTEKEKIVLLIGIFLTCIIFAICIAWTNSPTTLTIQFQMDNNTLEAVKNINWSMMK